MCVIHGSKENFQGEVVQSGKPVLVDFWADWCGPCRAIGPILDEIAREHPEIKVVKVHVDEQPELASRYQIMTIPTIILMKDGQIVKRTAGVLPKEEILKLLEA